MQLKCKQMFNQMPFVYFRMELVWHGEFDRLFSQYFPHMWCLVPTFYPPGDSWRTFKDSAKVRFSCQVNIHNYTTTKQQWHPLLVNIVHIRQAYPTQSKTCWFPCLHYQYATTLPTSDSIARYIHNNYKTTQQQYDVLLINMVLVHQAYQVKETTYFCLIILTICNNLDIYHLCTM